MIATDGKTRVTNVSTTDRTLSRWEKFVFGIHIFIPCIVGVCVVHNVYEYSNKDTPVSIPTVYNALRTVHKDDLFSG